MHTPNPNFIKYKPKFNSSMNKIEFKTKVFEPLALSKMMSEKVIINLFFDALSNFKIEEAKYFISDKYKEHIDLITLQKTLDSSNNYKHLITTKKTLTNKKYTTQSVLVINEKTANTILHFHFIKDIHSLKIYNIELEL